MPEGSSSLDPVIKPGPSFFHVVLILNFTFALLSLWYQYSPQRLVNDNVVVNTFNLKEMIKFLKKRKTKQLHHIVIQMVHYPD